MDRRHTRHFPFGTLAVNLTGALALGFLVTLLAERALADGPFRLLALVGFLSLHYLLGVQLRNPVLWQAGRWPALFANVGLKRRRLPAGHLRRHARGPNIDCLTFGRLHIRLRRRSRVRGVTPADPGRRVLRGPGRLNPAALPLPPARVVHLLKAVRLGDPPCASDRARTGLEPPWHPDWTRLGRRSRRGGWYGTTRPG